MSDEQRPRWGVLYDAAQSWPTSAEGRRPNRPHLPADICTHWRVVLPLEAAPVARTDVLPGDSIVGEFGRSRSGWIGVVRYPAVDTLPALLPVLARCTDEEAGQLPGGWRDAGASIWWVTGVPHGLSDDHAARAVCRYDRLLVCPTARSPLMLCRWLSPAEFRVVRPRCVLVSAGRRRRARAAGRGAE